MYPSVKNPEWYWGNQGWCIHFFKIKNKIKVLCYSFFRLILVPDRKKNCLKRVFPYDAESSNCHECDAKFKTRSLCWCR
jgi:hypothetical protein